ncbi:cysteine proteinase [Dothidotthia symphoricarpi CBS 119687]|uniref:Ubiquitin carboxyl-terminal hydrolase n=1 Tax=Dothidotthia symphoricarpi CBS 119687 TaxID=1392245 RepID=A0A6A6ADY8_9PLEO|nr:cysteine proteinase [Dothidotthia symphoricarpi CBS 119687]KAF2130000.1 cysteine proteinase [Dothidotthia symphoricarpi CBS 119687]
MTKQTSSDPQSKSNPEQAIPNFQHGEAGSADMASDSNKAPAESAIIAIPASNDQAKVASPSSRKRSLLESVHDEEPSTKKPRESPSSSPKKNGDSISQKDRFPSPPNEPATKLDKETWQGFCDIESEPTYFSVMLREMGVQGVTVREVFAMDPAVLETLPQPIYGLILLFRHREFGNADQPTECPANVWFANQLPAQNSCATLAMINILMNTIDVETGEHLKQFKDFTQSFTPFQRGEALSSFDFVKKIHNSFAKKMDILEADKHLSNKVNRARREQQEKEGKKGRRTSVDSIETDGSVGDEENAHHFIAFLPVGDEIWKLDGLDVQPTSLGSFDSSKGETWLSAVTDVIAAIMAAGDDDYGVIAMTQSPLLSLRKTACLAMNTLKLVETRLDSVDAGWKSFLISEEEPPTAQTLGVENQIATHPVPDPLKARIDDEKMADLLDRRGRLVKELSRLLADIMNETHNEAEEDQKATERRYDLGPLIQEWLSMLAGNGFLEGNLDRYMPKGKGKGTKSKK